MPVAQRVLFNIDFIRILQSVLTPVVRQLNSDKPRSSFVQLPGLSEETSLYRERGKELLAKHLPDLEGQRPCSQLWKNNQENQQSQLSLPQTANLK